MDMNDYMNDCLKKAALFLKLAPGWMDKIIYGAGDGNYAYIIIKDKETGFRIGVSSSDAKNGEFQIINLIYAMSNAFSVPIVIGDTES